MSDEYRRIEVITATARQVLDADPDGHTVLLFHTAMLVNTAMPDEAAVRASNSNVRNDRNACFSQGEKSQPCSDGTSKIARLSIDHPGDTNAALRCPYASRSPLRLSRERTDLFRRCLG